MIPIQDLLAKLEALDVKVWVDDNAAGSGAANPGTARLRCNAPKGVLTPVLKEELSARKVEIVVYLQQAAQTQTQSPLSLFSQGIQPALAPVPRSGAIPLSCAQQRLWFLDQLESGHSTEYNVPCPFQLGGELDAIALEKALQEIIHRHESLRTNFQAIGETVQQSIQTDGPLQFPLVDLQDLDGPAQTARVEQLLRQEEQTLFDLTRDSLMRATLVRLSPQSHVLLLSFHHIVFDGWSAGVFMRELAILYPAFCAGQPSPLPALPIQYADYAIWQRQWLQSEACSRQVQYWQQQFAELPPPLELPSTQSRLAGDSVQGCRTPFYLSPEMTQKLRQLSREVGATLFMTVLAAYAVLLYRYSMQEDLTIGVPVANRDRAEIQPLIGFFINTLALRLDLRGKPTFRTLVGRVRQTVLNGKEHQDLPFDKLVELLQPDRDLSHSPLFRVMFLLQRQPIAQQQRFGNLTVDPLPTTQATETFDLTLFITESETELQGMWEYDGNRFDADAIARIADHFRTLLQGILDNPDQHIGQLPLLAASEWQQLLTWQSGPKVLPSLDLLPIPTLFETQAQATPTAIAVQFEDQQLTYRALNEQANQLAHFLQDRGVGSETLVGLCVERSLATIVGILGILKAGGAYVPIDPAYPDDRITYILQDTQIALVLSQANLAAKFLPTDITCLFLDRDWDVIGQQFSENLVNRIDSNTLAYVIYTSGSTGKPKGVAVEHRSLASFVQSAIAVYNIAATDRILQFASISFDTAAEEIYPCLCTGATLVLRTEETIASSAKFWQYCRDWKLTVLDLPTAYWHLLTAELTADILLPPTLRVVIIGGEQALPGPWRQWQQWLRRQTDPSSQSNVPQLVNTYGPTETTVVASVYQFPDPIDPVAPSLTNVPIGRPLGQVQTYVLDVNLQPVPVGVPGELYIGGDGLARGYLNRPDLTAERFIPNPFLNSPLTPPPSPLTSLYKTGDRVRYLPGGNLEYLGRADCQVKLRGFRIELGEIEAALTLHPQVREAVVIVCEDDPVDRFLVAYVVVASEDAAREDTVDPPTPKMLRQFLKQTLPAYMVPSRWVQLQRLPLTANGKIDRRALPDPLTVSDTVTVLTQALNPIQALIAETIASVLKRDRVGLDDNFFELGGHSLLATRAISRLQQIFNTEIPLRRLFEAPTVAKLESVIRQSVPCGDKPSLAPPLIPRSSDVKNLPLSASQSQLWFLDRLEESSATYHIATVLVLEGTLKLPVLEGAIAALLDRHEVLRTTFPATQGMPYQAIQPHTPATLSILDAADLDSVRRQAQVELERPFDLATDAPIRFRLWRLNDQAHVLLIAMHHIVSDAWSMAILTRELSILYSTPEQDASSLLPPLPIQYADYALWQQQWFASPGFAQQLSYWKGHLTGAPPLLELPSDRPRPSVQRFRGRQLAFTLESDLSQALRSLSRQSGVTLYMMLLAAFGVLLSRYSGQDDLVIGTPVANRIRAATEASIGFFVNTLALRLQLYDNPSFTQVLEQVRQVALDAYSYQEVPFERVVEALQPERSLSYTPIFQVLFDWQEQEQTESLDLSGLAIAPLALENTAAKFDLGLTMLETPTGLRGSWEYNIDLFERETIARMSGHFQTLLSAIALEPNSTIAQLPLLSATERQQLLVEWSQLLADDPGSSPAGDPDDTADDRNIQPLSCIHQLFEVQVQKTPDAVAVAFGTQTLTYRQLNRKANQLAHHLQDRGVGPETLVGLCVERSLDMVIGLLGILKAGGAYVPIDPTYPRDRITYILEDTQIALLLTQQTVLPRLSTLAIQCLCLDRDWPTIELASNENPTCQVKEHHLAYAIYTSGSTGKPKGVAIEHRSLTRFMQSAIATYDITPTDRILQFASISFDTAVEEIYLCLCSGATLVLRTEEMLASSAQFWQYCRDWQLTVLDLPTAYWHLLAAELTSDTALPPSLRLVIIGGEAALSAAWQQWQHWLKTQIHHPPCCQVPQLINTYGPTEATVVATLYCFPNPIESAADESATTSLVNIPIGRPFGQAQIYVLDAHQHPVPIGVPGELYLGGTSIARGYLNQPDLTAERFIPNPFLNAPLTPHPSPLTLLYKTGDRVRYRADGNLEYLGRVDDQVKLRGFRIELGEIEALLCQHPQVAQATVTVWERSPGNRLLVAYFTSAGEVPSSGELRDRVQSQLPRYMVPAAFVPLDVLPLTANGKVDRRALPAPDFDRVRETDFVAPRTPIEAQIAAIFGTVLGLEPVGIHDNFFSLGGHSLLATQVIARLRDALQVEIPLAHLFEAPTVAELVAIMERDRATAETQLTLKPVAREAGESPSFPLSLAQNRLWFIHQLAAEGGNYTIPLALQLQGSLDAIALEQALLEIVQRHEILRTRFPWLDATVYTQLSDGQEISNDPPKSPFIRGTLSPVPPFSRGARGDRDRISRQSETSVYTVGIDDGVQSHAQSQPVQRVDPPEKIKLAIVDLQPVDVDEQANTVQQYLTQIGTMDFDLERGPVFQMQLLKLSPDSHVLLLAMHHIVGDGWSVGILSQELSTLYTAFAKGEPSPLSPLPIQYSDYAVWQQQWLQGERLQRQLDYWQQHLAGAPPLLELPTDYPRPSLLSNCGQSFGFQVDPETSQKLVSLSQATGATLFMTLLAAFSVLLSRYSNSNDILIGSPIANRRYRELEHLIGCFVNTLVFRTQIQGNPSFRELLKQVRQVALSAYAHQDVPFEQVVEALQPERTLSYNPLFQVMFVLQNAPDGPLALPGLDVVSLAPAAVTAQFDLTLFLEQSDRGLVGGWEFHQDLFNLETIQRLSQNFTTLLAGIAADPDGPVYALPLLPEAERRKLLTIWHQADASHLENQPVGNDVPILNVCECFAARARETPDAIALIHQHQHLTYNELNHRVDRLARNLQARGVGPETLVGLCVRRSPEMIIALLGILKAGGAYVPIDPAYPGDRIAYILQDTQVALVLTQHAVLSKLETSDVPCLCLDADGLAIARTSDQDPINPIENPQRSIDGHQLAYVIYTSGSTGKPKGVAVEHHALASFVQSAIATYDITPADRILQFASISFDTAAEEIYPCLCSGATLVLRTEDAIASSEQFWQCCQDWQLTVLDLPTAYWHLLATELTPKTALPAFLRLVIIGGEAALPGSWQQWQRWLKAQLQHHPQSPAPQLVNTYGPTETTVVATYYRFPHPTDPSAASRPSIPIGRPFGQTQVYVLDARQQPVPIGVPGELYLCGPSLARGYLNQPDLTAKQFIPNPGIDSPLTPHPSPLTPLYKTGDRVRYLADGNLEYLGRIDDQVKLRGFRIELGEIEAAIVEHPDVREAAVAIAGNPPKQRLIGYIVQRTLADSHRDLRDFLKQKLPDYMIPALWIDLRALPLSANGKIDRRALPAPPATLERDRPYRQPRNRLEWVLAQLWSDVLEVHPIGVQDNFFELGGHSLLGVSLMARMRQTLGRSLPLTSLFQAGTIEQQASRLQQHPTQWSPLIAFRATGSRPPLFCVHPGGGSALNYISLANHMSPEQPFYGLDAWGFDAGQVPHDRVEVMAAYYLDAVQTVQPQGPYHLAGWCFGGLVAFEMAQQLRQQGQTVAFVGLLDIFDFSALEVSSNPEPTADDTSKFMALFGDYLTTCQQALQSLPLQEQFPYVLEQAKQLDLIPPNFSLPEAQRLLRVGDAHDRAIVHYVPQVFPGQVTLIQAQAGIAAASDCPLQGWERLAETVELHWVPGDHRSLFAPPHVQALAATIQRCLAQGESE